MSNRAVRLADLQTEHRSRSLVSHEGCSPWQTYKPTIAPVRLYHILSPNRWGWSARIASPIESDAERNIQVAVIDKILIRRPWVFRLRPQNAVRSPLQHDKHVVSWLQN